MYDKNFVYEKDIFHFENERIVVLEFQRNLHPNITEKPLYLLKDGTPVYKNRSIEEENNFYIGVEPKITSFFEKILNWIQSC